MILSFTHWNEKRRASVSLKVFTINSKINKYILHYRLKSKCVIRGTQWSKRQRGITILSNRCVPYKLWHADRIRTGDTQIIYSHHICADSLSKTAPQATYSLQYVVLWHFRQPKIPSIHFQRTLHPGGTDAADATYSANGQRNAFFFSAITHETHLCLLSHVAVFIFYINERW